MCVTDRHDMTLAVKVASYLNATNKLGNIGLFCVTNSSYSFTAIFLRFCRYICPCIEVMEDGFHPSAPTFERLPPFELSAFFFVKLTVSVKALGRVLTFSSIYTHFNTLKKKSFRKTLWKKVKFLNMSNLPFSTMFSMQSVS